MRRQVILRCSAPKKRAEKPEILNGLWLEILVPEPIAGITTSRFLQGMTAG
jgi:hypothetical protein